MKKGRQGIVLVFIMHTSVKKTWGKMVSENPFTNLPPSHPDLTFGTQMPTGRSSATVPVG